MIRQTSDESLDALAAKLEKSGFTIGVVQGKNPHDPDLVKKLQNSGYAVAVLESPPPVLVESSDSDERREVFVAQFMPYIKKQFILSDINIYTDQF